MKTFIEYFEEKQEETPFAVFVIAPVDEQIAATTRAADRNKSGRIGLPGGKVDPGESPVDAAYRESLEEGWQITKIQPEPIHTDMVEGKLIWWYMAESATMLKNYKEQHRIKPILVSKEEIASSGYGNEFIRGL